VRGCDRRGRGARAPAELKYAFAHPETADGAMQAAARDLSPVQQQARPGRREPWHLILFAQLPPPAPLTLLKRSVRARGP